MDILALIEAHCRHVAAQVPRAAQGCRTALAVLLAIPSACARRLPDITGSRPELFDALVRYGLLPALPSRHTQTGVLRLLGRLTPLVEARSERHWAMWLAHALDPASLVAERLEAGTPESQRAARDPGGVFSPMRSRDHARDRAELQHAAAGALEARANAEREIVELRAALALAEQVALALRTSRDSLASRTEDLEHRRRDLESERTALRADLVSSQERVKQLQREATTAHDGRGAAQRAADGLLGQLDQLRRDLTAMAAARDRAVDDAAARRTELKTVQTRLDTAANALLAEQAARAKTGDESAALRTELSKLKTHTRLVQTRLDLAAQDLEAARADHDSAFRSVGEHRAQLDLANASLSDALDRIAALEDDAQAAEAAKLKEAVKERENYEHHLTAMARERDWLRDALAGETTYRQAAVEQLAKLTRDLISVRGERDAADEKIEVARDRLRRQAAEIAVRQLRAPLSAEIVAREVEVLLSRSRR